MNKDTIHAVISDPHSGSNWALFLSRNWQGRNGQTHYPTSFQIAVNEHKNRYCEEVKAARKNKPLKLVVNGDAIDGDHHSSGDVCTTNELEQAEIHIEIMEDIKKRMGWQRGDELYYTIGTQVHVGDMENYIAREMNAVPCDADYHAWNSLTLETNGTKSLFVHHGVGAGDGANEGNPVRNLLKRIHENADKDGDPTPDVIWTGHVHNPTYSTYQYRRGMKFSTMHGIITPSWQAKNTYAWMKAAFSKNKIGGCWQEITANGYISIPKFCVMGY